MTAQEDAMKAGLAALDNYVGQWEGNEFGIVEDILNAAGPILLAEKDAEIKRLRERVTALSMKATGIAPLRIAETAPDVPMSPDKGHAETAPEEGP